MRESSRATHNFWERLCCRPVSRGMQDYARRDILRLLGVSGVTFAAGLWGRASGAPLTESPSGSLWGQIVASWMPARAVPSVVVRTGRDPRTQRFTRRCVGALCVERHVPAGRIDPRER